MHVKRVFWNNPNGVSYRKKGMALKEQVPLNFPITCNTGETVEQGVEVIKLVLPPA